MNSLTPFIRHEMDEQPGASSAPENSCSRCSPPLGKEPEPPEAPVILPPGDPTAPGTQVPPHVETPGQTPHPDTGSTPQGVPMTDGTPVACRQKNAKDFLAGDVQTSVMAHYAPGLFSTGQHTHSRPVLHGLWGEDGTVQGLLELAGIPYVGCGVLASAVCMDKAVANALFEANGVPHTKWVAANRWEIESDLEGVCDGVEQKLGWPVFVKPANAGSSVGISKVSSREELKKAIDLALENDRKVVFEAFVDGQEVECAVIGSDPAVATRPGEILAGAEFYTYDDKYKNGVSQTVIPAHLPEAKLDEVKTYAAMAYTALNCEGLARCDFFVEHGTGRVLINEINTFPGFTSISMYPKLMEHEGLPVPQLIDRLIALALERKEKQHG